MGKKVLQAGNLVAVGAVVGYVICLFLPLHKAYYTSLGGLIRVVDVTTYSLTAYYGWHSSAACWFARKLRGGGEEECNDDGHASVWLQDTQASLCTDVSDAIIMSACSGYGTAYAIGMCMFLIVLLNIIAQGITFWLIQQYMHKPKKQYREVAFFLDLIGCILMLICVITYVLAITRLSAITTPAEIVIGTSNGVGASYGYWFLYFFILVQVVSVVLLASGSNSQEAREAELREQRKFMAEMQMFDQFHGDRDGQHQLRWAWRFSAAIKLAVASSALGQSTGDAARHAAGVWRASADAHHDTALPYASPNGRPADGRSCGAVLLSRPKFQVSGPAGKRVWQNGGFLQGFRV